MKMNKMVDYWNKHSSKAIVLNLIKNHPNELFLSEEIASRLGMKPRNVRDILRKLYTSEKIDKITKEHRFSIYGVPLTVKKFKEEIGWKKN